MVTIAALTPKLRTRFGRTGATATPNVGAEAPA
jgi:hypothetical protein